MKMSRMTRRSVCVLILASMTLLGAAAQAAPKRRFVIATAGTAGALYPMGVAMAETINKHSDRSVASAESSAALVANIRNMDDGKVEWGISQSEIASFAYTGTEIFTGKKVDGLQALFATVGSWVQIFVPADSPVKSVADLKGRRVGVGSPGSGGEVDARMVLAHYGLDYKSVKPSYITDSEMVSSLRDGSLDAMICTHPLKSAALLDLTTSFKVRMLSVADDKFYKEHPYFLKAKIGAGAYANVNYDVFTPYSRVIMFTHKNAKFSEDDVFHLLDVIFANRDEWRTSHALGIADANPMQTGWSAWKLGMAGFIVPFMFVYNRALLLEGQWYELLPIVPGWATDLGGLALMLAVYLTSVMRKGAAKKGTPEVGAGPGPGTRT